MNYNDEKKTIKLSLFVLFIAFILIYILLFQIKWDKIKDTLWETNQTTNNSNYKNNTWNNNKIIVTEIQRTKTWQTTIDNNNTNNIKNNTGNNIKENNKDNTLNNQNLTKPISTGENNIKTKNIWNNTWNNNNNNANNLDNQDQIYILSGTELYNGPLESIKKLWIQYKYALKDDKDIYYIPIQKAYNWADIIRQLWGNLYILNTETEILKNKLFWEKITFINIPEFKNKIVIILAEVEWQERLIQVSYTIYHESKLHIKQTFM